MPVRSGWSEKEVRATVSAYLGLLKAEQAGAHVNKTELYRKLSLRFPERSPKAFELKFQNISAVLYEQRLPYCAGLKPRHNYQRLLRLLVLDQLDRTPLPAVEPQDILFAKLRELAARGPIPVTKKGAGRFGLVIEEALGIAQNSDKAADFMGIELKTKTDTSLQTLFSRTPSRFVEDPDISAMFRRHSYFDRIRGRRALYTSFSKEPDSLGFRLVANSHLIRVMKGRTAVLEYDAERIEAALLSKHTQTAFLSLKRTTRGGLEFFTIENILFCQWPSIIRFLRLASKGEVFLDFTLSKTGTNNISNHGFLWRVRGASLKDLYLTSRVVDLKPTTGRS